MDLKAAALHHNPVNQEPQQPLSAHIVEAVEPAADQAAVSEHGVLLLRLGVGGRCGGFSLRDVFSESSFLAL